MVLAGRMRVTDHATEKCV